MQLTKRIAIAAGALTLGTAGIAAAAGAPSDHADEGLTKASAQVGIELPASRDSHPEADDHADDPDDLEDETVEVADELEDEVEAEDDLEEGTGPVDNHGAEVSAVATSDETEGRDHGIAVSEVARQGHGKGPAGESSTTHGRP
jgi:hypothetical protein